MKNWNKTGKIKAIILGFLALPNLIVPIEAQGPNMILMPLIFFSLALPLIVKVNAGLFGQEIIKPTWNDNPLTLKRPLSWMHYMSFFFLTVGISLLIGTGIKFQTLSFFGLSSISGGIGILIGIWLTLKWTKTKK